MNTDKQKLEKLQDILNKTMKEKVEEIVPNFRKKNVMSDEELEKIISTISIKLDIPTNRTLVGMMLLFLQGATSAGAPGTMSIDMGDGKILTKKNIVDACSITCNHSFIRRIAEKLAPQIGQFALKNNIVGELAYRINTRYKADTGNSLSAIEMAYCSSFSQSIPNLAEMSSERLVQLLAEDYQKRFENKKKQNKAEDKSQKKKTAKVKKRNK